MSLTQTYKRCIDKYWSYQTTPLSRGYYSVEIPQEDVKDLKLNLVTFGVNCARYLAVRTLLLLTEDCESVHPFASEILRNQMYVDGILAGAHSFVEAIRNRDEIIHVLNRGGFSLRKWTSNDRGLIEDLPPII